MEFVRTRGFDRDIKRIGASKADVDALIAEVAEDPDRGDVIKGLGGARKLRFALKSRGIGKSGGGRVIYAVLRRADRVFLLMAFAKAEQADLTSADRKAIAALVAVITQEEDDR